MAHCLTLGSQDDIFVYHLFRSKSTIETSQNSNPLTALFRVRVNSSNKVGSYLRRNNKIALPRKKYDLLKNVECLRVSPDPAMTRYLRSQNYFLFFLLGLFCFKVQKHSFDLSWQKHCPISGKR